VLYVLSVCQSLSTVHSCCLSCWLTDHHCHVVLCLGVAGFCLLVEIAVHDKCIARVRIGLAEKFTAGDAGQLVMPDPDIVRQLTSVSYTLDGASAALNRVTPEHLDLSSDQVQSQWFVCLLHINC